MTPFVALAIGAIVGVAVAFWAGYEAGLGDAIVRRLADRR